MKPMCLLFAAYFSMDPEIHHCANYVVKWHYNLCFLVKYFNSLWGPFVRFLLFSKLRIRLRCNIIISFLPVSFVSVEIKLN